MCRSELLDWKRSPLCFILFAVCCFHVYICFSLSVIVLCTYSRSLTRLASSFGLLAVLPSPVYKLHCGGHWQHSGPSVEQTVAYFVIEYHLKILCLSLEVD